MNISFYEFYIINKEILIETITTIKTEKQLKNYGENFDTLTKTILMCRNSCIRKNTF